MNLKSPKSKYVTIDPKHPSPVGVCDDTGFVFNKEDLVPQMEYRGDQLVPTGFLRGRPFIDEPQPQLRPPIVKSDPYPVKDPRLPQPSSPGYYPEGIPAPSNEVIMETLVAVKFTDNKYVEPTVSPLAPQGAPDGIGPVQNTPVYAALTKASFGW